VERAPASLRRLAAQVEPHSSADEVPNNRALRRRARLASIDAVQEVIAAAEDMARVLAAGDAEQLLQLPHDQFMWITHVGAPFGRSEYIRRNTKGHTV
jgi:hypothetical protein